MVPRSKSSGPTSSSANWTHEYSDSPYTTWNLSSTGTEIVHEEATSYNGFDIEKFHSRRRRGELIPFTPFTQFEYSLDHTLGVYGPRVKGTERRFRTLSNWSPPLIDHLRPSSTALAAVASQYDTGPQVQSAAAKIYAQGHDSLTFILELHKTITMFKSLTRRVESLGSELRNAGNTWLEYRYGWRTLWFDILDFHKGLQLLDDDRKRFSQRVGYTDTYVSNTNVTFYEDSVQKFAGVVSDEYSVSIRGAVVADIEPPAFRFNPILTGWELIRFSFIIDWFVGVGTWLESLSFLALTSQYTAAGGILVTLNRTVTCNGLTWKNGYSGPLSCGPSRATAMYTVRTPQSVPTRPFSNINLDVPKVVDLLAIFGQLLTSGKFRGSLRL